MSSFSIPFVSTKSHTDLEVVGPCDWKSKMADAPNIHSLLTSLNWLGSQPGPAS